MSKLNPEVKVKIEKFLTENGHKTKNLTDSQLVDLYWDYLDETIKSSEKDPIDIRKAKKIS